jgi:uncharacterized membrane protein YdbT with pleckstrin-like domain
MKKLVAFIVRAHNLGEEWLSLRQQKGAINMNAILIMALMGAVCFIVLANLWPSMQTANTTIQANTATDVGTTTSKTVFGLLLWIIPLGIGIALIIRVLKHD